MEQQQDQDQQGSQSQQSQQSQQQPSQRGNHNDFSKTWESVENDPLWNGAADDNNHNDDDFNATSAPSLSSDPFLGGSMGVTSSSANTSNPSQPFSSCVYYSFQACHVLDFVLGVTLLLSVAMALHQKTKAYNKWGSGILVGLATVWILRATLAYLFQLRRRNRPQSSPSTTSSSNHCGIYTSANLSVLFMLLYGVLGCVLGLVYLAHKNKPSSTPASVLPLPSYFTTHPQSLYVTCFGLALLESVRWAWIQLWLQQQHETQEIAMLQQRQNQNIRRHTGNNPFWWSAASPGRRRRQGQEPLLDSNGQPHWTNTDGSGYDMDDAIGSSSSSRRRRRGWWPFSSRDDDSNNNPRDDDSVDYASLNEDWASRSQEDPFWWTQEGEGGNNHNHNTTEPA